MNIMKLQNINGYSLFELVMVMIIISILMTASMSYMGNSVDVAKTEETKEELNQLAIGIVGDEELVSGNHRIDYGYVGDIGALPTNLSNLVTNPGLATWDGPYIKDDYYASTGSAESEYTIDGWGKTYSFSNGISITSTGSSTTITKNVAQTPNDVIYNSASFNIVDIDLCPPGTINKDSVIFNLTYPNGLGSYQTDSKYPSSSGFIQFDSIPIGQQTLSVIELKNNDTLNRKIHIDPKSSYHYDIQVPTSLWCDTTSSGSSGGGGSSGAIEYVSGSAQTKTGKCDRVEFDITNTSGSSIDISNIIVTWSSPTAFYEKVRFGSDEVVDEEPQIASGATAVFDNIKTITAGQTVTIRLDDFEDEDDDGDEVNMANTDFTVTFSDGSVVTFNSGNCP